MKNLNRTILDCCVLVVWILSSGWYLGAFTGFPKGLDTYQHLTMTKYILKHWPDIRWYPNWYGGTPFYLWYSPLPHVLNALLVKLFAWSIEYSIISLAAVSLFLISLGVYGFVYFVTKDHDSSLIVSLIVSSSPMWGFLIGGGAYARVMAVAFLPLAALFTLMYIKNLETHNKAKKYYLGTVFLITATIISHLQAGFLTSLIVLFLLVFCIDKWKTKIWHVFKIFIPVAALSAFFIVPFFASVPKQFVGEIHAGTNAPVPLSDIFLTYPGNWNTVSALILPIGIMGVLILRHRKLQFDRFSLGILKALGAIVAILFIYTFTRIPSQLYIFSPYDSPFYLTLYLAAGTGIILGRIFMDYGTTKKRKILTTFLLASVLIAAITQLPILHSFVNDTGAQTWYSGYYATQNLVKVNTSDTNYRFGTDWEGASTWFNYWYDVPQTKGFFPLGIMYPNWYSWLENAVWKDTGNYEETNYLLDWYAVKSFAVAWPYYNYEKFLNKSQDYEVVSKIDTPTLFTMYEFNYKFASPIISASNATTMLIIGEKDVYDNIFYTLAYTNFNDKYVVPIRGPMYVDDCTPEQLNKFDVVFVALYRSYYRNFDRAWELLDEYVANGGGLIIETGDLALSNIPTPSPVNETENVVLQGKSWNFSVTDHDTTKWINFLSFSPLSSVSYASLKNLRSNAEAILWSQNQTIAAIAEHGEGRVLWEGLSLTQRVVNDKNLMEATFFSRIIEWVSKTIDSVSVSLVSDVESSTDWSVAWTTTNAQGNITLDHLTRKIGNYSLKLGYNFSDPIHQNQVNYLFNPSGLWNWSDAEFFSLWLYGDGSNHEITVYLQSTDYRDSYWFTLRLDWKGWRQITYWFDQMNKYGLADIASVDRVEITVNNEPHQNATSNCIYVDGMYVGARNRSLNKSALSVRQINPENVEIYVNQAADGVLFKENYFNRWHAYLTDAHGTTSNLDIYHAGPDFMYVNIPKDTVFPVKVIFLYEIALIDWLSYTVSLLALISLISYGLWGTIRDRLRFLFERFKRGQ